MQGLKWKKVKIQKLKVHLRQTTILKFTHQTGSKLSELIQEKKKKKKEKFLNFKRGKT